MKLTNQWSQNTILSILQPSSLITKEETLAGAFQEQFIGSLFKEGFPKVATLKAVAVFSAWLLRPLLSLVSLAID